MPMLKYHPDARFLTDYAAASLPSSQAVCVAAHLHYCAACRLKIRELTALGAELFMQQEPVQVGAADYEQLHQRIATLGSAPAQNSADAKAVSLLPRAINKLANGNIEQLRWRHIGSTFRFSPLNVGDRQRETSLFFIKAGGKVPQHRHQGDEITVILEGSFSDHEDKYNVGDFIVRTKGETHQPVASQDQDCLCLSTLDAPLVMSNWLLRLAMRWLNRKVVWPSAG
jgi:putative transcriptional regulator